MDDSISLAGGGAAGGADRGVCGDGSVGPVSRAGAQYKTALPGYRFEFPRDHFNHEDFQTEWWYTTGNLIAADGHHYGFELTFFRQGADRDPAKKGSWDIQDLYL